MKRSTAIKRDSKKVVAAVYGKSYWGWSQLLSSAQICIRSGADLVRIALRTAPRGMLVLGAVLVHAGNSSSGFMSLSLEKDVMAPNSRSQSIRSGFLVENQLSTLSSRSDSFLPVGHSVIRDIGIKQEPIDLDPRPLSGNSPVFAPIQSSRFDPDRSSPVSAQRVASSGGGMGQGGGGIGGGGGIPGGGTPGGNGGGGGRPGEPTAGNNLSVPAIFIGSAPELRGGGPGQFYFAVPATSTVETDPDYFYFAQGVKENTWQADSIVLETSLLNGPVVIDYVNIGDALESAPIRPQANVRFELTLFKEIFGLGLLDASGKTITDLTGFEMQLLGGAKGKGKPSKTGPTESQGARFPKTDWIASPAEGDTAISPAPAGVTYETPFASVYAADASMAADSEAVNSYMQLSIQKVSGVEPEYAEDQSSLDGDVVGLNDLVDFLTNAFRWDGFQWRLADSSPPNAQIGDDIASEVKFGPELTISGTYNVGASGQPWQFPMAGDYLVTFALDQGAPIAFGEDTLVRNDNPALSGFQPTQLSEGRLTQVVPDGTLGVGNVDTHNGLLAMLIRVPSTVGGAGEESMLSFV